MEKSSRAFMTLMSYTINAYGESSKFCFFLINEINFWTVKVENSDPVAEL